MNKTIFGILLFFALSFCAFADDLLVTVTPPSTWSDGSAVNAGDIGAYDLSYDCAGTTASAVTDQTTHTFQNVPNGVCTVSASAIDQNGVIGALAQITVTTGLTLIAPAVGVDVDTGTSLDDILSACQANPNCTSVTISP